MQKRNLLWFIPCIVLFTFLSGCVRIISPTTSQPKTIELTQTPQDPRLAEIDAALQASVHGREDVVAFMIYKVRVDHINFSQDGTQAVVWFALMEPTTGQVIPGEPGLALAAKNMSAGASQARWKITLQADPDWSARLAEVPVELLSQDMKERYLPNVQEVPKEHQVFTGYRLPWKGGVAKYITGSIGHVLTYKSCPATCMYAFDFADGTMFPVLAAKAGKVKYAVWKWPNNNHDNANFLVLEDDATSPVTFQVYYHLAQDSIPPELRSPGAQVYQGQFIGNADNTGPSTGSHLHFHVHANPKVVWGASVDIVFEDVPVNGGRPRTCDEASRFPDYGKQCSSGDKLVSGNYDDAEPPTGDLTEPQAGQVIKQMSMQVSGWGKDDKALASMQLMVNWDGKWKPVGPLQTASPFNVEVDVCQVGIPDGPFLLGMEVRDQAGHVAAGVPGQRLLEKNYDCNPLPPPQVCNPGPSQVGLYADPDYKGECVVLGTGDFESRTMLGEAGANGVESIRVGSEVMAVLYDGESYQGQNSSLVADSPNLANDPIGANTLSSLSVQPRPPIPAAPQLVAPRNQQDLPPTEKDTLTLSWSGNSASREYRSELSGPNGFSLSQDWQNITSWKVGVLPAGDYEWLVRARNPVGTSMASMNFSVSKVEQPPATKLETLVSPQKTTALLLHWQVTSGDSDLDHFEIEYRNNGSNWQAWNRPLPAQLRQAWFIGLPGHGYEFRLRGVGIRGGAEPFPEQAQASVLIETDCQSDNYDSAGKNDNSFSFSSPLEIGELQEHNLCGLGDEDWVAFPAQAGLSYHISTTPLDGAAAVNIQLYANDGYNLLGEAKPSELNQPAEMDWVAKENGIYYLRLSPLDAGLAGSAVRYQVRVANTSQVYTPPLVCSSLLLPVIWFIVRFYLKKKQQPANNLTLTG